MTLLLSNMNHEHYADSKCLFYAGQWCKVCPVDGYVEVMFPVDVGYGIDLPIWYRLFEWDKKFYIKGEEKQ